MTVAASAAAVDVVEQTVVVVAVVVVLPAVVVVLPAVVAVAELPPEETDAGEAGAAAAAELASGVAPMGADAVGDAAAAGGGAETEAVMEAAPEAAVEAASGLSGQLNAGCDAGGCGNRAAAWPLWTPPFSSLSFPQSGYPSSRPLKIWSSPRSGNARERSPCPPRCQNGPNDSTGTRVCWRSWSQI